MFYEYVRHRLPLLEPRYTQMAQQMPRTCGHGAWLLALWLLRYPEPTLRLRRIRRVHYPPALRSPTAVETHVQATHGLLCLRDLNYENCGSRTASVGNCIHV